MSTSATLPQVQVTAELPLLCSTAALALAALLLAIGGRVAARAALYPRIAMGVAAVGAIAPLVSAPLLDPVRTGGRALWQWSAAGGPTIQASYRLDGIAAIGVAVGVSYAAAGLFGAARASRRHPLLPGAIIGLGLIFIALAVTEDLIAGTIVLGALAAVTVLATLAVAPLPATTRLSAYLAVGVEFFVLAALLVSRYGGASFRFDSIVSGAISPGVVLTASIAAAMFAGLYPFVPWRFGSEGRAPELRRLRGIVTMPAGVGASLLLLRLIGATRGDITTIALPGIPLAWRAALAVAALLLAGVIASRRGVSPRLVVFAAAVAVAMFAYPALRWAHLILIAALVSVLYAAAVSLALPEQWDVVRFDVTLAAFWIGLALGTPIAIAGALFVLIADAATALAEAAWIPPHRAYVIVIAGSTATLTGLIGIALGAATAQDHAAQVLAIVGVLAVTALVLIHVGRRLNVATVPLALDGVSVVVALGATMLLGFLAAIPLYEGVTVTVGRAFAPGATNAPLAVAAIVSVATLLVVIARSIRPFVPDLAPFAERLQGVIAIADPVPVGLAAFAGLDRMASASASIFTAFERRAGVWLAAVLIIVVLAWSVR